MTHNKSDCSQSKREGEISASVDPALLPGDAHVVFIGRIRSPWKTRSECPKNMRRARERAHGDCWLEIDEPWRPGLAGVKAGDHLHILYWMHAARRDLIVQRPRHRETPAGVFTLRSPVRPNPIAMALVKALAVDESAGRIEIDATDALDGTALLDIKPYLDTIDAAV